MRTYEEVKKLAEEFVQILKSLNKVINERERLMELPNKDPIVDCIITGDEAHDLIIDILHDIANKERRVKFLLRQENEYRFALRNLEKVLSECLIPNSWYVFDEIAFINCFWVEPDGQFYWRIDYETYDDHLAFLNSNKHNMYEPVNYGNNRPIGFIEWCEKYVMKS